LTFVYPPWFTFEINNYYILTESYKSPDLHTKCTSGSSKIIRVTHATYSEYNNTQHWNTGGNPSKPLVGITSVPAGI
jgi:hypothetical protein